MMSLNDFLSSARYKYGSKVQKFVYFREYHMMDQSAKRTNTFKQELMEKTSQKT
jgi:hypothetical protein